MAIETQVVIVDLSEVQSVAQMESPILHHDGFGFTGFDRVHLCTLLSLLSSDNPYSEFDS